MADVRPLRGVRFDRSLSGPIGPLIAPPYDAVEAAQRCNGFRVGLIENVEVGTTADQHALAAARYRNWRERGILRRDEVPALYLHHHRFHHNGTDIVRTGLVARVRLSDWSERIVLPHERTTAGPRTERLQRLRSVEANLSPLYLLLRDPSSHLRNLLTRDAARDMPFDVEDRTGGWHQIGALTSSALHQRVAQILKDRTLFVADGHHRYEAALAYRNERRHLFGQSQDDPSEFVLALLVAVEDPGVLIQAIHRLIEPGAAFDVRFLVDLLRRWFDLRPAERVSQSPADGEFLFRVVLSGRGPGWDVFRLSGNPHESLMPTAKGPSWRSLPISALETILQLIYRGDATDTLRGMRLTIDEGEAMRAVNRGEAQVSFLLPPPNLDQVIGVAEEGDLMPAKSTWFEPKAPAGLVINELDDAVV